jgi:hypothetical protein
MRVLTPSPLALRMKILRTLQTLPKSSPNTLYTTHVLLQCHSITCPKVHLQRRSLYLALQLLHTLTLLYEQTLLRILATQSASV